MRRSQAESHNRFSKSADHEETEALCEMFGIDRKDALTAVNGAGHVKTHPATQ
jgi:hypothetical protein